MNYQEVTEDKIPNGTNKVYSTNETVIFAIGSEVVNNGTENKFKTQQDLINKATIKITYNYNGDVFEEKYIRLDNLIQCGDKFDDNLKTTLLTRFRNNMLNELLDRVYRGMSADKAYMNYLPDIFKGDGSKVPSDDCSTVATINGDDLKFIKIGKEEIDTAMIGDVTKKAQSLVNSIIGNDSYVVTLNKKTSHEAN